MSNRLYTINEMSKLHGVSTHTLRYYDKEDVLKPEVRDENTGYRYYSHVQFGILNIILHLRDMGFSLSFIKRYFTELDYSFAMKLIEDRTEENKLEMEKLVQVEQKLKKQKEYFSKILDAEKKINTPFIEELPEKKGIWIGIKTDFSKEILRCFTSAKDIFKDYRWREDGQRGLIVEEDTIKSGSFIRSKFIVLKESASYKDIYIFKGGKYLCMYFKGSPDQNESIRFLLEWAEENNLEICGDLFIEFLAGPGLAKDIENFIQLLKVPVR